MGTPGGGGAVPDPARAPSWGRRHHRVLLAGLLVAVYAGLSIAVLAGSALVSLDEEALRWQPTRRWPQWEPLMSHWVLLGQRLVCLVLIGGWLAVRFLQDRDPRPLLVATVTVLLLNATVGAAKMAFGRLGPLQLGDDALRPGAAEVFADGMVFPSGHAANAVAMWGLAAYLVTRHRRLAAVVVVLLAVSVGSTTVYLGTHWVSDVLAGWVAGALVVLALPTVGSLADRAYRSRRAGARERATQPAAGLTAPVHAPAPPPGGIGPVAGGASPGRGCGHGALSDRRTPRQPHARS